MKATFTWHAGEGVASIVYVGNKVDSEETYQEWCQKVDEGLSRCLDEAGERFPLVVDIDELDIQPGFRERYGHELAPRVGKLYATAIARYGSRADTRSVVALEAMRRAVSNALPADLKSARYDANLFRTRAEAVAYVVELSRLRKERGDSEGA